ncbi:carboxypeptidase-like regulatory domain-containing protein [Hymenobacter yonginensis]|uniref:Carboxypeptidase-like regulatory domain-containing protein n=1 Tax=Hymenobacter yonginensis TaxID=748197 RepID=A0ABY7PSC6_9BACT|nr:carboxypeptidase-like regulatory domain-containing protein [Hymenobacter yonginensis]WBO85781.1 carboxypeptidase-like regulatory domain-containing protein [Hymenobacter yonginensis]
MPTKFTVPEPETDDSALLSEEEDYSSGNGRLALIVGAILLLAVIGYMFLPGSSGRRVVTTIIPSVMLGEASVTGAKEVAPAAAADVTAAEEKAAADAAKLAATDAKKPTAARPAAEDGLAARTTESVAPVAAPVEEAAPVAEAAPAAPAAPATVTLSGRILDEDGRPMAGATVLLKGSRKGTGTDANGNYTLEVPAGENALVYGYGGYQDQEIRTRGSQPVNVTLLPSEGTKRRRK